MTLYEITGDILKLLTYAEDPDVDDQAFQDTMESLSLELEEKADGYAKAIRTLQGEVDTLSVKIKSANNIDHLESVAKRDLGMIYQTIPHKMF